MDEELDYLWETLGLEITADLWPERDKIHPTLRPAITVVQAKYRRASFFNHADVMARGTPRP